MTEIITYMINQKEQITIIFLDSLSGLRKL